MWVILDVAMQENLAVIAGHPLHLEDELICFSDKLPAVFYCHDQTFALAIASPAICRAHLAKGDLSPAA